MTILSGTVLPLVLVYGAVLVLLLAARRPPVRRRVKSAARVLVSIAAGGYAMFGSAMTIYCAAQGAGVARCVTTAGAEAGVLAVSTVALGLIGVLIAGAKTDGAQR